MGRCCERACAPPARNVPSPLQPRAVRRAELGSGEPWVRQWARCFGRTQRGVYLRGCGKPTAALRAFSKWTHVSSGCARIQVSPITRDHVSPPKSKSKSGTPTTTSQARALLAFVQSKAPSLSTTVVRPSLLLQTGHGCRSEGSFRAGGAQALSRLRHNRSPASRPQRPIAMPYASHRERACAPQAQTALRSCSPAQTKERTRTARARAWGREEAA